MVEMIGGDDGGDDAEETMEVEMIGGGDDEGNGDGERRR